MASESMLTPHATPGASHAGASPAGPPSQEAAASALPGTLRQLQTETLIITIAMLFCSVLVLLAVAWRVDEPDWIVATAVLVLAALFAAWWMRARTPLYTSILVIVAAFFCVLMLVYKGQTPAALTLLAVPIGLTTVLMGTRWGVAAAFICTLLLAADMLPGGFGAQIHALLPNPEVRAVAIALLWATVALFWIALRTLFTAVEWAWLHSEKSQMALEEARDAHVQLQQVLEDLSAANVQLTRLNQLAHGLREMAETARRAKEEFVANVSHELRTPLNMIIGFSRMIVETPQVYSRTPIPPALLSDLTVILRNSQHLSNLVDDVLDLSQIEADRMALTRERTDLREVIESAVTVVRPLFESKHFYLETDIAAEIPPIFMDRTRIREVLLNLLSNAGRFTERGGVHLRAICNEEEVQVSVIDTGPGIDTADISKLFLPFQQLDHSLSRRHDGTGLGLTLSKRFVELHGGRMWVESNLGQGSTFVFTLPFDTPHAATGGPSRWLTPGWSMIARTRPSLAPMAETQPRFVVLDEAGTLSRLVMRYLDGCEVTSVTDMHDAARELAATPAQALLLTDPALLHTREHHAGQTPNRAEAGVNLPADVPVILCPLPAAGRQLDAENPIMGMAGMANLAGVAIGATATLTDYLVKPISQEELISVVVNALKQQGRAADASATVLLVDDEPDELRLFWRMLSATERRYRILTASNGVEALAIMREERPDVVISDLVMPEMDGFQLVAACNANPALRDIPLIILSARDPQGHPIVSESITATLAGGLSAPQVLACIEALSTILSPLPIQGAKIQEAIQQE